LHRSLLLFKQVGKRLHHLQGQILLAGSKSFHHHAGR